MLNYSAFLNDSVNTSMSYEKAVNTKSNNKELSNENFKRVLNSNVRKFEDSSKQSIKADKENASMDNSKINELKEKINSLKEKVDKAFNSESKSSDESTEKEIKDILNEIASLLMNLFNSETEQKVNVEENTQALIQNLVQDVLQNSSDPKNDLQTILELLDSSVDSKNIDSDTLNNFKELLASLSKNADESSEVKTNLKQDIDSLKSKINEELNQGKVSLDNSEATNKSNSQNSGNSFGSTNEENSSTLSDSKLSKDDKFLNSLLDDDSNTFDNKIGMFSNRVQVNNAVNTTENRGLTINEATFADDLITDVKYMTSNNLKELVVKVNPGNLGQITIELIQEDGVMKANLKANSKETTALLSQNIAEIQKELTEKNIKISEVNIELYNEDTTFFSGNFNREFNEEQKQGYSESASNLKGKVDLNEEQEEENNNIANIESNLDFLA